MRHLKQAVFLFLGILGVIAVFLFAIDLLSFYRLLGIGNDFFNMVNREFNVPLIDSFVILQSIVFVNWCFFTIKYATIRQTNARFKKLIEQIK